MRTQQDILQESISEKDNQLPELSSDSLTAIWLMWLNITSFVIHLFEGIVYAEQAKLEGVVELKRYGTVNWYITRVLEFQLGDLLSFDSETGLFSYPVISAEKQIVVKCSITEQSDASLLIKVAKGMNGSLVPLDLVAELPLLFSYINEIKVGGTVIYLLSQPSDVIDGQVDIYYDGNINIDQVKVSVQESLFDYRDNFAFNGVLLTNDLVERIRETIGVDDVYFNTLTGTSSDGSVTDVQRDYRTFSGYFNYADNWVDTWNFIPRHEQ